MYEDDSCVTDGSGDEGDAGFSHAAFNYNRDSTGVDNPATPMAATSSRVGVNVQRYVGRTKVAKQRTADRRNSETVRQLQMELDIYMVVWFHHLMCLSMGKKRAAGLGRIITNSTTRWSISGNIKSHFRRLRRRSWTLQKLCVLDVHR